MSKASATTSPLCKQAAAELKQAAEGIQLSYDLFRAKLLAFRRQAGMSQWRLAEAVGITTVTLSHTETSRSFLRSSTVDKFLDYLEDLELT